MLIIKEVCIAITHHKTLILGSNPAPWCVRHTHKVDFLGIGLFAAV